MIEVQNDAGFAVAAARLEAAAALVLQQHDQPGSSLTIVLAADEAVADLNREFRGVESPTDVLSFPADMPLLPDEPNYLGDVIIAYPYAVAQAQRENQDVTESLLLLAIHGTLHLLGYDHDTTARRAEMWAAQDEALRALHLPLDLVPALEAYESND
jgi:probable rRNA maturation factor